MNVNAETSSSQPFQHGPCSGYIVISLARSPVSRSEVTTMLLDTIFAAFVSERPICVMARGTLERLLDAQRLDTLFARTAQRQYTRELLFSSLVQLMSEVVLGVHPTVHAAYQANKAAIRVSTTALY